MLLARVSEEKQQEVRPKWLEEILTSNVGMLDNKNFTLLYQLNLPHKQKNSPTPTTSIKSYI